MYVVISKAASSEHSSPIPTTQSGEVWHDVAGELAQEGLRPVTPDQEALQEVLHSHEEKAENTLQLQVSMYTDNPR